MKWSDANAERETEMKRAYASSDQNKERRREAWRRDPTRNKKWKEENKEKVKMYSRRHHLMSEYGLTLARFAEMLAEQGGRCAICQSASPGTRDWHVDHDHATNAVRGLLCNACNKGLGLFRDSPAHLLAAERYLQLHRSPASALRSPASLSGGADLSPSGVGGHFLKVV